LLRGARLTLHVPGFDAMKRKAKENQPTPKSSRKAAKKITTKKHVAATETTGAEKAPETAPAPIPQSGAPDAPASALPCQPWRRRCTLVAVSPLENIVEDLKSLPPPKLKMAADYIQRLKDTSQEERQAALARTFGCLSPEEADQMEKVIEEGCEQINEHGW